jgi:hypothetical protein
VLSEFEIENRLELARRRGRLPRTAEHWVLLLNHVRIGRVLLDACNEWLDEAPERRDYLRCLNAIHFVFVDLHFFGSLTERDGRKAFVRVAKELGSLTRAHGNEARRTVNIPGLWPTSRPGRWVCRMAIKSLVCLGTTLAVFERRMGVFERGE